MRPAGSMAAGGIVALASFAAAVPAAAKVSALDAFIPAIRSGDFETAAAMIRGKIRVVPWQQQRIGFKALTPAQLFERVRGCAFEAGIRKEDEPIQALAWICPLTPTATSPYVARTVLVEVKFKRSGAMLDGYSETDGMRPVPAARGVRDDG